MGSPRCVTPRDGAQLFLKDSEGTGIQRGRERKRHEGKRSEAENGGEQRGRGAQERREGRTGKTRRKDRKDEEGGKRNRKTRAARKGSVTVTR